MVDNESQEMYLETILRLKKKKGSVRAIDIAEELGYSKPSVSRAVGIMKKDGFIVVHADGLIDLTETGKDKAENIFSRHKSLTQALVVMGLSPEAAEENAFAAWNTLSPKKRSRLSKNILTCKYKKILVNR